MIARSLWPLQRWLAARPSLAIPLACAPVVTIAAVWRPPAALLPFALASAIAMLVPVVVAREDGSRRRFAGRATGAALVIAQPLALAAIVVDARLLVALAAAALLAVILPAVFRVREQALTYELVPETRARSRRILPMLAMIGVAMLIALRSGLQLVRPQFDASMVVTLLGCVAIWIGVTMRPLLAVAIGAATILVLAVTAAIPPTPIIVALALTTPLAAWFQRESSGGFPVWMPALVAVATITAYAADPAWQVLAMIAALTWLIAAAYPMHTSTGSPTERRGASIIAWSRRLFVGLEPYWRFYARAKFADDPVYRRLARERRDWGCVLDAGCGPGLTAALAAGRRGTTSYLGIDLDLDKLLVARRALSLSGRKIGGAWRLRHERLPMAVLPIERFDTVLILDVLHYWPDDQQATTLTQLASLLQTDGRLFLREGVASDDGVAGTIERGERFTTFFGLNPENALTFPSADRIAALITGAGLAVETEEPMGGENRLWICRRV